MFYLTEIMIDIVNKHDYSFYIDRERGDPNCILWPLWFAALVDAIYGDEVASPKSSGNIKIVNRNLVTIRDQHESADHVESDKDSYSSWLARPDTRWGGSQKYTPNRVYLFNDIMYWERLNNV